MNNTTFESSSHPPPGVPAASPLPAPPELRNWVFVVLMDIGWRVNIRSTGLAGLKFHLGAGVNPRPPSFDPSTGPYFSLII